MGECEREFESTCERSVDSCIDDEHGYAAGPAATCVGQLENAHCNDVIDPWFDQPACKQVCERTAGRFEVAWRFQPVYSCSQLGIKTVSVITSMGSKQFVDSFDCWAGSGTTDLIPVGTWNIRVELHDENNQRVWATERAPDAIDAAVVDLGEIVIPVSS